MPACPSCGADRPAGKGPCPACGAAPSRRRLLRVLGWAFAVLFLLCGGVGTWLFLKAREFTAHMAEAGTPLALYTARVQVVNFATRHGDLPPDLVAAAEEPIRNSRGQHVQVRWFEYGGTPRDVWERPIRYTRREDGTFEVRSDGPDGVPGNGDDLVEAGSASEELAPLVKGLEERAAALTRKVIEIFGFDPEGVGVAPAPEAPSEAPEPPGEPR